MATPVDTNSLAGAGAAAAAAAGPNMINQAIHPPAPQVTANSDGSYTVPDTQSGNGPVGNIRNAQGVLIGRTNGNGTATYNAGYVPPQYMTSSPIKVAPSSAINSTDIKATTPIPLPPQPTVPSPSPYVAGFTTGAGVTPTPVPTDTSGTKASQYETDYGNVTNNIKALIDQLTGKTSTYQGQLAGYNVPDMVRKLGDLNSLIASKTAAYNAASNDTSNEPILLANITGRQAYIDRQKAVDIGGLSAAASALQGNISTAETAAKDSVDLQYQPLETALQYQSTVLSALGNSPAADAYKAKLASMTSALTDEKTLKARLIANAAAAGDEKTVQSLTAVPPGQANTTALLYSIGQKYVTSASDKLDAAFKQSEINKNNRAASGTAGSGVSFTQTDVQALARAGLAQKDILNIQNDINAHGLVATLNNSSLTQDQKNAISTALNKTPNTQFITPDWLKTSYGASALATQAKDAGFTTGGGFLGFGATGDVDAYLKDFMTRIQAYRDAGYTDQDILKQLTATK